MRAGFWVRGEGQLGDRIAECGAAKELWCLRPVKPGLPVTAQLILLHPHVPQCRRRSGLQGTLGNVWVHFCSS